MSEPKEVRRLWLYDNGEEPFLAYHSFDSYRDDLPSKVTKAIEVIEHSAYLAVCAEMDALRSAKLSMEIYREQIEKELRTQLTTQAEKLKLAREALEFYSNHGSRVLMSKDMQPENGRIAREALAQLGDEKEI